MRPERVGPAAHSGGPPLRFELDAVGEPRGAMLVVDHVGEFALAGPAIVGRGKGSDIVLRDPTLSRTTAKISFAADGQCFIEDLASACASATSCSALEPR